MFQIKEVIKMVVFDGQEYKNKKLMYHHGYIHLRMTKVPKLTSRNVLPILVTSTPTNSTIFEINYTRIQNRNILVMLYLHQYGLEYFTYSTNMVTATFFFSDLIQ